METPIVAIRKAFYEKLLNALPIDSVEEKDIAWPNVGFCPDLARVYISPMLMFSETRTVSLSEEGFELLSGVFQVTVFGVHNHGEMCMEVVAQKLVDLYRGGTRLLLEDDETEVLILAAYRGSIYIETGQYFQDATGQKNPRPRMFVYVNWQCYVPKSIS